MPAVNFPTARFPTPTGNGVVSLGLVFIGVADTDPSVLANRISVTVIGIDGIPVVIAPASQPFVLNSGGIFTYAGSPVQLRVSQNYSMSILSATSDLLYYFPSAAAGETVLSSLVQLTATTTPTPIAGTGQFFTRSVSGIVEFFYMDSAGNEIQFTQGGQLKVSLASSAIAAASLSATGEAFAGYYRGSVQQLTIVGGVVSLDWHAAQYFYYTNTQTHTIDFSNLPLIGEGIGQTIMLAVENSGNFAITLNPELGYTIYVRSIDNPFTFTVNGIDIFILSVFSQDKIVAVPLYDFLILGT